MLHVVLIKKLMQRIKSDWFSCPSIRSSVASHRPHERHNQHNNTIMSHLAGHTRAGRKLNYVLHHAARFPLIGRVAQLQMCWRCKNVMIWDYPADSRHFPSTSGAVFSWFRNSNQRNNAGKVARGAPPQCKRNLSAGCRRSLIPMAAQDFGRWQIKNANRLILSGGGEKDHWV